MKRTNLLLLGSALLLAAPLWAQEHTHHPHEEHGPDQGTSAKLTGGSWQAAHATWQEVREGAVELDHLIAAQKLDGVHDAALNLRDSVRELRSGWQGLAPQAQAQAEGVIRRLDGLLDSLHESADHNELRGVVKDQRTLHVLLDQIAAAFPSGVLKTIGPVLATGAVKDPYCRMAVDPATAAAKVAFKGQTYYFCSSKEGALFQKNPAPYVALYDELAFGKPKVFQVGVTSGALQAGQPETLVFAVREQGQKALVNKFQLVHEKLMHLIVVSDDLAWFSHEHPQMAPDGRFYLKQTFPRAGRYYLFSDFTPATGSNQMVRNVVRVGGGAARSVPRLTPDAPRNNQLHKSLGGFEVALQVAPPLQAGRQSLLTYTLRQNGQPVTNLQPYLGAMGHLMAIHQNGRDVVHTHAVGAGTDPVTGLEVLPAMATAAGPAISFKLQLPSAGLYRVWVQFQQNGRVLTVPFTFAVKSNPSENPSEKLSGDTMKTKTPTKTATKTMGALAIGAAMAGSTMVRATPAKSAPKAAPQKATASKATAQKVMIMLPDGYKSGAATVKAGQPVALTFHLTKDAGCGNTVSVPTAQWTKSLKVGEKATVTFTPKKSGPLAFACSMEMLKGTLTVK